MFHYPQDAHGKEGTLWAEEGSRGEEEETHAKVAIFIFLLRQLQLPTN